MKQVLVQKARRTGLTYMLQSRQLSKELHTMTPTPTGIEAAVCADVAQRQAKGIAKYGTTVADNPLPLRDWLQHAYEETLDKAVYLKRAIAEIDGQQCARWLPARTDC